MQNELSSASSMEKLSGSGVFILPILVEDCDVPPLLLDRRYANFKEDPESAYLELTDAIYHHFKVAHPDADVGRITPQDVNRQLLQHLVKNRQLIHELSPRRFDEVVASVFESFGYSVELTAATKDGGKDLVVLRDVAPGIGPQKYIIECKRYKNTVGADVVQRLAGVVARSGADRGILVTTSSFTKPAREASQRFSIDLVDYPTLFDWLKEYVGGSDDPDDSDKDGS